MAEFQAIVLAGGSGIRLYPLTEDTPKSLLPINGRPLLWYQLQLLESSGFSEAIVVTGHELAPRIEDFITRTYDGTLQVEIAEVTDNCETGEALREIADRITRDFIVIAGDLVTDAVLHDLADCHRLHDSTVTMLLKREEQPTGKNAKPRRDKEMTDCFGLTHRDQRVVLLSPAVHMNDDVEVPKSLLKRRTRVVLHSDLYDAHLYIFSHWVLRLLMEKKHLASIKADLLPHLVRRQFRGPEVLPENLRPVATTSQQQLATSFSLTNQAQDKDDVIRCFANIMPANGYCERADCIPAYRAMDTEVGSRLRISKSTSS